MMKIWTMRSEKCSRKGGLMGLEKSIRHVVSCSVVKDNEWVENTRYWTQYWIETWRSER